MTGPLLAEGGVKRKVCDWTKLAFIEKTIAIRLWIIRRNRLAQSLPAYLNETRREFRHEILSFHRKINHSENRLRVVSTRDV